MDDDQLRALPVLLLSAVQIAGEIAISAHQPLFVIGEARQPHGQHATSDAKIF